MHELGITEGIIARAREAAERAAAVRVTDLYLIITPAADFTTESIEMYFEMLTDADEYFGGARLHWEARPAAATCLGCGHEFEATEPHPACPSCGLREVRFDPRSPMLQLTDIGVAEDGDEAAAGGDADG
jgi:Zn finger protein HypA/HybF involved in hydrogenase expression